MSDARDRLADRYVLLERLGQGGMATVYRAWDERLEVFRAIKILAERLSRKARIRRRLENEAKLMAKLQHPNVVTVHEMGEDGARLYLVMELLVGGTVWERVLRSGPLPPRMGCAVADGVLSALQEAHSHGVVHRDVKPHNVLLDGDGTPKVADFGIARLEMGSMTRTGAVMGTLAYMPPEQKLSATKVDARSDVYSTGATLFALLTGQEPFDLYAAAMDDTLAQEFYATVPDAVAAVLRRATAFRMEDRFESAEEMRTALAEAAASLPDDPPAEPLVSPDQLRRARERASMGPTLLEAEAVTESDAPETYDETPVSVSRLRDPPAPVAAPPEGEKPAIPPPHQRWGPAVAVIVLLLVPLGALMGFGLLWYGLAPEPAVAEVAAPPPAPPPPPDPVPDPVPDPDPVPAPEPAPVVPVPVPVPVAAPEPVIDVAPEPEPVPEPEPAVAVVEAVPVPPPPPPPAPAPKTGWRVEVLPTGKTTPRISGRLRADNAVTNRDGVGGRPELLVSCEGRRPELFLDSGVPSVELMNFEVGADVRLAEVGIVLPSGEQKVRMEPDPALPSKLELQANPAKWVRALAGVERFELVYAPFSSPPVRARFTNTNVAQLVAELEKHCKF